MLENINHKLFYLINATPTSPKWLIILSKFIAKYLINIVPVSLIIIWFWEINNKINIQRKLAARIAIALIFSSLILWLLGYLFPHNRPFADCIGYNFLSHIADNSFPSNHSAIIFTFSLAILFWHCILSGIILIVIAISIAWSRIYLGIHWPLDVLGSFIVGLVSCLSTQILWNLCGMKLYSKLEQICEFYFANLMRK